MKHKRYITFLAIVFATIPGLLGTSLANGSRFPTKRQPLKETGAWPTEPGEVQLIELHLNGELTYGSGMPIPVDLICDPHDLKSNVFGKGGALISTIPVQVFNIHSPTPNRFEFYFSSEPICNGQIAQLSPNFGFPLRQISMFPALEMGIEDGNHGLIAFDRMPPFLVKCRRHRVKPKWSDRIPLIRNAAGFEQRHEISCDLIDSRLQGFFRLLLLR